MMNRPFTFTLEHAFYLALFGAALAVRLYGLGAHPLTDAEAREALTAYRLVNGIQTESALLPHSPAYFFFTALAFMVFDAGDAIARVAPALFGAALVFAPLFFREALGRGAALTAGALLAISAGLLAASRTADGALLALFGLVFGLSALRRFADAGGPRWLVMGAVCLGVGVASGAAFLTGLVIVALAALVMTWAFPEDRETLADFWAALRGGPHGRAFLVALGLTVLIVSTVALIYLRGLSALADSWVSWLAGFAPRADARAPLSLAFFLLAYEPLVVVFGLLGAIRAFRSAHRLGQWLTWLALAGLLVTLIYGGRSMTDMIWVSVPLAGLAAYALAGMIQDWWAADEWPLAAAQTGIVIGLLWFASVNLAAFGEQARVNDLVKAGQITSGDFWSSTSAYFNLTAAGTGMALTLVIAFLFGMGWSTRAAKLGLAAGFALALFNVSFSAAWGLTQLRANQPVEIWWAAPERPTADEVNWLMTTLSNVSNYAGRDKHDIEVTVQADPNGALGWALRRFRYARFVTQLDPGFASPVVIAPATLEDPTLGSSYVGQDFALRRTSALDLSWTEWIGWWVFRRAPVESENVILWVRQDIQDLQTVGEAP
jgi:hypothetical protein